MHILKIAKLYIRDITGASAVEFALFAPILIFILVGTIDFGFYTNERMKLHNTTQATADYVAQVQDDTNARVIAEESYRGDFSDVTLTSEFSCECSDGVAAACPVNCNGDDYQRRFVSVNATRNYTPLFPYPGISDLVLQSTVRMRVD